MHPDLRAILPTPVAEHEIHVLYEIDGVSHVDGPARMRLGNLLDVEDATRRPPGIPEDQLAALKGRYAGKQVWKRLPPGNHRADEFVAHASDLLNGRRELLCTVWALTDEASRFLADAHLNAEDTPTIPAARKHVCLELRPAAEARLRANGIAPSTYVITISEVMLTLFATGHGVLDTGYVVSREDGLALSAIEILEVQIALGRLHEAVWRARVGSSDLSPPFSLGQLMRRLVLGGNDNTQVSGRATTHTFLRLAGATSVAARDRLGVHLARQYACDYETADDLATVIHVSDFNTVRHAVALEGAATILGPAERQGAPAAADEALPPMLAQYRTNGFRRTYLPISILALHEQAFLIDCATSATLRRLPDNASGSSERHLVALREKALLFRLLFRFPDISYLSMHNAFLAAWRKAYGTERLLAELNAITADITGYLADARETRRARDQHERDQRYFRLSLLGSAVLSGWLPYQFVDRLLTDLQFEARIQTSGAIAAAVVTTILVAGALWLKRPSRILPPAPGGTNLADMLRRMSGQPQARK